MVQDAVGVRLEFQFKLDLRPSTFDLRPSTFDFELDFRVGLSSWTFELELELKLKF